MTMIGILLCVSILLIAGATFMTLWRLYTKQSDLGDNADLKVLLSGVVVLIVLVILAFILRII